MVLGLAAFAVFFYLPQWVQESQSGRQIELPHQTGMASASSEKVPVARVEELREQAYLKDRAEQVRDRVLSQRGALDEKQASLWGGEDYRGALASLDDGDEQLRGKDFAAAAESYERASNQLESVSARAGGVLREALADGERALSSGDASAAASAFRLAAAIDPGNRAAATGLKRSEVLDEVLTLLASGAEQERRGELQRAAQLYGQAASLDPLSQSAKEALARVDARFIDEAFTLDARFYFTTLQNRNKSKRSFWINSKPWRC